MKKTWPIIRKANRPGTGEKAWLVDGRFQHGVKSHGKRHYCDSEDAAKELARQLKIQRGNEGASVFEVTGSDVEELRAARERLASFPGRDGETILEAIGELVEARKLLARFGGTVKAAAVHFAEILSTRERLKSRTVSEVIGELVEKKERRTKRGRPISAYYRQELRSKFAAIEADFGGREIASIDRKEIEKWLDGRKVSQKGRAGYGKAVSAGTFNNFRRCLGLVFSFGVENGYCLENPAAMVDKAKAIGGEVGILTVTQTAQLLATAPPEILPYIAIGAFAGLRRAEIERLNWSEIDLGDGLIEVKARNSKTARRRFVHISENLAAWLRPYARQKGPVIVGTLEGFRAVFDAARLAAGITEWPANALRHSFASYHLAAHRDAAALALELGHTDSALLFEHYRQLVKPADAAAYWQIVPDGVAAGKVVPIGKVSA